MSDDKENSKYKDYPGKKSKTEEGSNEVIFTPVLTPTTELKEEHDECFYYIDGAVFQLM